MSKTKKKPTSRAESAKESQEAERKAAQELAAQQLLQESQEAQRLAEEAKAVAEEMKRAEETARAEASAAAAQEKKEAAEKRAIDRGRQIQQIQLLEEKDREISDLNNRVFSLKKAWDDTQIELEAEQSARNQVQVQLDAANSRLQSFDEAVSGKIAEYESAQAALVAENTDLKNQVASLSKQVADERASHESAAAAAQEQIGALKASLSALKNDRDKDDAESTVLMKLLHAELQKLKETNRSLQSDLERRERDDVKNTIMLGMLQTQVDTTREESAKSADANDDLRRKLQTQADSVASLTAAVARHEGEEAARKNAHENALAAFNKEAEMLTNAKNLAESARSSAEQERATLQTKYETLVAEVDAKDRSNFETVVRLRTDLEARDVSISSLSQQLEAKTRESVDKEANRTSEINSLTAKLNAAVQAADAAESAHFKESTLLKSENQQLAGQVKTLEEELKNAGRKAHEREVKLIAEADVARVEAESKGRVAEIQAREHELELARKISELETTQRQLANIKTELQTLQRESTSGEVSWAAEKEALKARVLIMESDMSRDREEFARELAAADSRLSEARQNADYQLINLREELRTLQASVSTKDQALAEVTASLESLQTGSARREKDAYDKVTAYKAEVETLKNEIAQHKETIGKLEGSVTNNYNYQLLSEKNDSLLADVASYKTQIANLQNTIATMKLEGEILDSYKSRVLQDASDQQIRRIAALEKEHRMTAPLITRLVNSITAGESLSSELQNELDVYKAQMSSVNALGEEGGGSVGRPSTKAGTLPSLSPLARPGSANRSAVTGVAY